MGNTGLNAGRWTTDALEPADGQLLDGWVVRAQAGDSAAFANLYEHFAGRVYRFCLARVGSISDAEDLTQLTFLKLVEALPRYEQRGQPFAAWLFRVARNVVIDFVRARHEHADLDGLEDAGRTPRAPGDAFEVRAGEDVERLLPFLTPEQRDVIVYRFYAGLSARETANAMGRHEAAVRALQFRAIAAMRRQLARTPTGRPVLQRGALEP